MPDPKILVCNVGSSTFKVSYHDGASGKKLSADTIEGDLGHFTDSLEKLLPELATVQTVLHRIVHAGAVTEGAFELDAACRQNIQHWSQLAPLHNSQALKIVELLDKRLPAAKQYAIFDSGLYSNLPDVARHYAIPDSLDPQWPIQRYGFHGLAHRSQWRDLQKHLDFNRAITLQLGSGCSASAWLGDQVIDTSMGFTPLDGLMMARRSGAIDPGILLHLLTSGAMSPAELESLLNQESGLAGITRSSGDLREILAMNSSEAKLAVALFCYQIKKQIGAYNFALGGLDVISFGGGIGEHQFKIRAAVLADLESMGISLNPEKNTMSSDLMSIHADTSKVAIWVTPVDEMQEMINQYFSSRTS